MKEKCLEEYSMVLEWIAMRKQTIEVMRDTADEIDKHYKNINISRIAGAGAVIAGGAIGGIIGTLITGGLAASIAVSTAASIGSSVTGGGTSAGASIADIIISKLKLSDVQKQIDDDNKMLQQMVKQSSEIKKIKEALQRRSSQMNASFSTSSVDGSGMPSISNVEVKRLNIAEIVMSGISLYKGSETKAASRLREKANEYEDQMNNIMTLITPDSQ